MILSHRDKYIFFAVPKTGTHAIRFALRPLLGEEDEEQVGLYVKRKLSNLTLSRIGHGHITCLQAKNVLGSPIFNDYFKFGFVRNPYDRFISYFFFINRQERSLSKNLLSKMKYVITNKNIIERIHLLPQSKMIGDSNGDSLLDYTAKYETFQESFNDICSKLNLPQIDLDVVNASIHENWKQYYDDELKKLVYSVYQKDFEKFEYEIDF